jgi:diacylglycerol kinase family enzyme
MKPEAWLAIVNPHSGGKPPVLPPAVRTVRTQHRGHASDLAAAARDCPGLYVAGGDGTIFEVLQTMDRERQSLAVIPCGRGNSLARDLTPRPTRIDLMEITLDRSRRYFSASTIALGYPVTVAETADRRFHSLGRFCYMAAAACLRPHSFSADVAYGSGGACKPVRLTGFIANNTRHIANFRGFPDASCCDGSFDAMELRRGFLGQAMHNLSALAGLRTFAAVTTTDRAQVSISPPQTVLIDGELFPNISHLEVRLLPRALTCWRYQP